MLATNTSWQTYYHSSKSIFKHPPMKTYSYIFQQMLQKLQDLVHKYIFLATGLAILQNSQKSSNIPSSSTM